MCLCVCSRAGGGGACMNPIRENTNEVNPSFYGCVGLILRVYPVNSLSRKLIVSCVNVVVLPLIKTEDVSQLNAASTS